MKERERDGQESVCDSKVKRRERERERKRMWMNNKKEEKKKWKARDNRKRQEETSMFWHVLVTYVKLNLLMIRHPMWFPKKRKNKTKEKKTEKIYVNKKGHKIHCISKNVQCTPLSSWNTYIYTGITGKSLKKIHHIAHVNLFLSDDMFGFTDTLCSSNRTDFRFSFSFVGLSKKEIFSDREMFQWKAIIKIIIHKLTGFHFYQAKTIWKESDLKQCWIVVEVGKMKTSTAAQMYWNCLKVQSSKDLAVDFFIRVSCVLFCSVVVAGFFPSCMEVYKFERSLI